MIASVHFSARPRLRIAFVALAAIFPLVGHGADAAPAANRLLEAVRTGQSAQWRALLAQKSAVNARDTTANTPLHLAALNHDVEAVRALLAAGAEAKAKNSAGATPLHLGAGHADIVRALLAAGADPNAASNAGGTPLMATLAQPASFPAVQALVEAGADVRATRGGEQAVMLNRAIVAGHRPAIDLLLARGAIINPTAGTAPLALAAAAGDVESVRALLARGADPDYNSGLPGHALNWALFGEQPETARLLIAQGANLRFPSTRGHATPPMVWSAYNQDGDPTVAKALLAAGVEVNATSDIGVTALHYALRTGPDTPLVRHLRSVGAKEPAPVRESPTPNRAVPPEPAARAALIRERIPPAIELLQRSSAAFLDNANVQRANCRSCHQQDLAALTFELAHERGFRVDDREVGRVLTAIRAMWTPRAEQGTQVLAPPLPDAPNNIGYGFFALKTLRYPRDAMTDGMAHYLLRTQRADGAWTSYEYRPPMEDGPVIATAWAALGLRDYAPPGREAQAAAGLVRARQWLATQQPKRPNEAVFQIIGLGWAGESTARLQPYVDRLLQTQRADGGWAQLPALESDAWATGTALYALHDAAKLPASHRAYQRGVEFLLRTQYPDGSWHVRTRVWPFQPHFDGQFPHGKDQWISAAGTAWAAAALLFTLEADAKRSAAPTAEELIARNQQSPAMPRRPAVVAAPPTAAAVASTVDFARDIQPLFERSCAGCHGGTRPRAGFNVATRDALLRGGASGEPAIVPGQADTSLLFRYASGKIEDLEMPPLDRRDEYPGLNERELELVRAWIEAGAPWATVKTASANTSSSARDGSGTTLKKISLDEAKVTTGRQIAPQPRPTPPPPSPAASRRRASACPW